jgi:hypothetical protein
MLTLPNGKPIDEDMLEEAMENSDPDTRYFLNIQTGEIVVLSEYADPDEQEELEEEIDGSNDYVRIERITSYTAYQWMADFVDEIVAPQSERVAEKLSRALRGKGAFRRFKDALRMAGEKWEQAWYQCRDEHLQEAMREWMAEEFGEDHNK